jgi:hypothetical protein
LTPSARAPGVDVTARKFDAQPAQTMSRLVGA